ncbi:MAG: hypothetical protein JSS67_08770 [Bacteroidetes bacterium]|nr:hypothetical protein [Bacteroidota bacterium]
MNVRKFISCIFSCVFSTIVIAQNFGGTPAKVKWQEVKTKTARIIFPKGYDTVGLRISSIVQNIQEQNEHPLGNKNHIIDIVIHPYSNVSNAFVKLAPFESEFYLHPPSDALSNGAISWEDQLSIHEYRHVQQYNNFNTGLSKVSGILFGENARALANAASVPDWFFEGDAVYNETYLSHEGRGRLPDFLEGFRQIFADRLTYSYATLRNGSFQKFIPDHYALGYMLTAYGYEKYDPDFWKNVTQDAAAFRPLLYPFQGAIKKYAGISFNQFTQNAFSFYRDKMITGLNEKSFTWLTGMGKKNITNYLFPYTTKNNEIIVLKNSSTKIPAFYLIGRDGHETKIAVNDISQESYFSYNNDQIIYSFSQSDIRYADRDFTGMKIIEVPSGKTKMLLQHTHYFTPDISHDGKKIIAIQIPKALTTEIHLLDTKGNILKQFQKTGIRFSFPKFSRDDQFIYVLSRNKAGEMGLDKLNISTGSFENILPLARRVLGNPVISGDTILFTCAHDQTQETWAFDDRSKKIFKTGLNGHLITQSTIIPNGHLVSTIFTSNGYRLVDILPAWEEILPQDTLKGLYVQLPFRKKENEFLQNVPVLTDAVFSYNKWIHPFHFHSWNPFINSPEYSFNVYGQNILNTIQSTLAYTFNADEKSHKLGMNEIYGGWFVQPFFGVDQTWHRSTQISADTILSWNELNMYGGLRLPLNFSGGKQYRYVETNLTLHHNSIKWTGKAKNKYSNDQFPFLQYHITYRSSIQQAKKQIYPHLAEYLSFQYAHSISHVNARQLNIQAQLFLPGLFSTHSLVLSASLQNHDTLGNYLFSNQFVAARGYNAYPFARNWKVGVTYHFPILYPDAGFNNIVYFLRIRGALFFDDSGGGGIHKNTQYKFRSAGGEIYFDTKWWNQQAVTFGIRYSYLLDNQTSQQRPHQWELILPVNLWGK